MKTRQFVVAVWMLSGILTIGNGPLGAMVFGGVNEERLQLNEDMLWAGGPYDPVNPDAKVALPDVRRLVFDCGRYLLISSSRPGTQPANLQGIWNDSMSPPWGGKYTIYINTKMDYWPAEPCNPAECVEPLIAMVTELAETGARTAKHMSTVISRWAR